ncbi:hypothetical protein EVAR_5895_1 [Eumeta japonica]|uniref:Uncharacterized protein n=1 Tax=Eumeta variegata TaxID=151549 RepID=A0A4C1TC06_EUMVA|nr:hypothetical protein EVAR_5895_1 [Eumeta japonica]
MGANLDLKIILKGETGLGIKNETGIRIESETEIEMTVDSQRTYHDAPNKCLSIGLSFSRDVMNEKRAVSCSRLESSSQTRFALNAVLNHRARWRPLEGSHQFNSAEEWNTHAVLLHARSSRKASVKGKLGASRRLITEGGPDVFEGNPAERRFDDRLRWKNFEPARAHETAHVSIN